jgi:hypothetical protein
MPYSKVWKKKKPTSNDWKPAGTNPEHFQQWSYTPLNAEKAPSTGTTMPLTNEAAGEMRKWMVP